MKKTLLNLLLLVFTCNQALAYAPSQEDLEISKALDEITRELSQNEKSMSLGAKRMSPRKFERKKRKLVRKLDKEISMARSMNQEEQLAYYSQKNEKKFSKLRNISEKIANKRFLTRKLARKARVSEERLIASIRGVSSEKVEAQSLASINKSVEELGGYEFFLEERKEKLVDMTYEDYIQALEQKTQRSSRKGIASDWTLDVAGVFVAIAMLFVVVGGIILTIIFLIIIAVGLIAGFAVAPFAIAAGISGGVSLLILSATYPL